MGVRQTSSRVSSPRWGGGFNLGLGLVLAASQIAYGARAEPFGAAKVVETMIYVDCAKGDKAWRGGSGSLKDPIRDLQTLNKARLTPGSHIRFKRGSTCVGMFKPAAGSSGAPGAPIRVEAYGEAPARPVIAAGCRNARAPQSRAETKTTQTGLSPYPSLCATDDGTVTPAAVHLKNVEYWEIRDLELTNDGLSPAARVGLLVELEDFGTGHHYLIDNVYVHHVRGQLKNKGEGDAFAPGKKSGGIQFRVSRPAESAERRARPTNFAGVRVENSEIFAVDLIGLSIWSEWMCRPVAPMCGDYRPYNVRYSDHTKWTPAAFADWYPSTDVVFRNNLIHDIGGDGVIVRVSRGARVESNLAHDLWMRADGNSAGLWVINADDTLFRYNEVYGVRIQHAIEPGDGMAFDADMGTIGARFIANFSHDNEGGMALFCGCNKNEAGRPAEAIAPLVENNFSLNDGRRAIAAAGATAALVRNNQIVTTTPAGAPIFENIQLLPPNQVRFEANRFYSLGGESQVVRLKNPPAAFEPVEWVDNRFIGAWADNLPGGVDRASNRFEAASPGDVAAQLLNAWAESSGFAQNRYRPQSR